MAPRMRTGDLATDEVRSFTLDTLRRGDSCEVLGIGDEMARISAMRFGMSEGARISCVTKIPAGPIVVRSGRQEIAVGRGLARRITVRPVDREER
ncbi:MAG: FeoA family protein [Anaerosomatales bacterium]|nr:FeoA family protein [Anaerosomatales bacterium]MDT8433741.1 FeoA family protein [Anaerosomatales bacterium]